MSEKLTGGAAFLDRIATAHKVIWDGGRYPLRVTMNLRTARFFAWYVCVVRGNHEPPQITEHDRITTDTYPEIEIVRDIPDMSFGWVMGHADKRPDRIGPGNGGENAEKHTGGGDPGR